MEIDLELQSWMVPAPGMNLFTDHIFKVAPCCPDDIYHLNH